MKPFIKEENGVYSVYVQRSNNVVPILVTKNESEATLMLKYLQDS